MMRKESRIVDQRLQFLSSYQKEEMSVSDLCREYEVSCPRADKWIKHQTNMTRSVRRTDRERELEIDNVPYV
jgi:hypothetical protein